MDLFGEEIIEKPKEEVLKNIEIKNIERDFKNENKESCEIDITSKKHKDIFEKLISLFKDNRLHHSNILYGTRGIGKFELSIEVAKFILCSNSIENYEKNLTLIDKRSHPDLLIIENENLIGVDEIRAINHFTSLKSSYSRSKIIIINKIDNLNLQASNAILKLLEDPQDEIYYFLISDDLSKIIQTIRSRSVLFNVENLRKDEFFKAEGISNLSLIDAKILKDFSNCSIEYSQKLLSENILSDLSKTFDFVIKKDLKPTEIEDLFSKYENFANIIKIILHISNTFNPSSGQRVLIPTLCENSEKITEFLQTHRKKTSAKIIGKYFDNHDKILQILSQKEIFNLDTTQTVHSCLILIRQIVHF